MSSYCRKLEVGGTLMSPHTTDFNGSVYSYNNFQQFFVRIDANLILTTNDITESIQSMRKRIFI
jgi:Icc-related predicted phosphoesterase